MACSSDAVNSPSVLSAALRFPKITKYPSHNAQEFGVGAEFVDLKEGGASAYCYSLARRGPLFWNGGVISVNVSRPVVWGAPKPYGAVPPCGRGAQIVRLKTSGENMCWIL
jgi:hypothetical protein